MPLHILRLLDRLVAHDATLGREGRELVAALSAPPEFQDPIGRVLARHLARAVDEGDVREFNATLEDLYEYLQTVHGIVP